MGDMQDSQAGTTLPDPAGLKDMVQSVIAQARAQGISIRSLLTVAQVIPLPLPARSSEAASMLIPVRSKTAW